MPDDRSKSHDAVTTPVGVTTICPQCGVVLDAITTTCGACGAVITSGGSDGERAERVRSKLQEAIGDAFVLGDLLGRGGMGIVFRAKEKALDRDVALKVLAFDPVLNPDAYARFEREAKLAAKLDHPNIVPIFSVGQRNAIAFYTMRMVRGGSVEQMITPGQGLDVAHAINILRDVASALDYAHANGVVHRDIKPANILISDSGHAMVADFGIARAFGGESTGATATGTGVVGSPAYMSPEQWRGEKVDGRADQYALGVLAFELLSGRRPFADASMQELLRLHLSEDPPDIVSFRDDLPSHVADAIWSAMAKDPADRYPNTLGFVSALEGTEPAGTTAARAAAQAARVTGGKTTVKQLTPMPTGKRPSTRTAQRAPAPRRSEAPGLGEAAPAAPTVSHRSTWLIAALLVLVGALGTAVWMGRGPTGLQGTAALPPAGQGSAALTGDSSASIQRAQAEENARLQKEVEDAKRIALEAEHKMELMAAAQRRPNAASKELPAEPPHGHLFVMARGGTPAIFVDGEKFSETTPAVVEVKPGRHVVTVKGGQEFVPSDYTVDLVVNDTQQVVFVAKSVSEANAARQRQQQQQGARQGGGAAAPGVNAADSAAGAAGAAQSATGAGGRAGQQKTPQQVIDRMGFDPRAVRPDTLSPPQRRKYTNFMRQVDSVRQLRKRPGG